MHQPIQHLSLLKGCQKNDSWRAPLQKCRNLQLVGSVPLELGITPVTNSPRGVLMGRDSRYKGIVAYR